MWNARLDVQTEKGIAAAKTLKPLKGAHRGKLLYDFATLATSPGSGAGHDAVGKQQKHIVRPRVTRGMVTWVGIILLGLSS